MNTFIRILSVAVMSACIPATAQVDRARGGVVSPDKFGQRYALNSAYPGNIQIVPDPAGSGRSVLMARIRHTDPKVYGGIRTEISPYHEYVREGVRWYAMSVYFPHDWQFHPYPTVVSQLHTSQKSAVLSPPLSVVVHGHNLDLELHANPRSTAGPDPALKATSSSQRIRLGRVNTGQWYCFVIRADWSSTAGRGTLTFWLNGDKVYESRNMLNAYQTHLGNYPKAGLYMPGLMGVAERTIYLDFIHLGGPRSNFEQMAALTPCGSGTGAVVR